MLALVYRALKHSSLVLFRTDGQDHTTTAIDGARTFDSTVCAPTEDAIVVRSTNLGSSTPFKYPMNSKIRVSPLMDEIFSHIQPGD